MILIGYMFIVIECVEIVSRGGHPKCVTANIRSIQQVSFAGIWLFTMDSMYALIVVNKLKFPAERLRNGDAYL